VLKKVKTYVKKYRKSPKAKAFLGATSFKKKLIGFVKTRWFSDLAMGRSVIEAFEKPDKPLSVLTEKMSWDIEISVQDIRTLKVFCEILDPFAKHTDILGGENYSTVQLVLPTLLDLFAHLDEMSLKPGMLRFCDKLENEIKKYFTHIIDSNSPDFDPTYIAATYLDPCWTVVLDGGTRWNFPRIICLNCVRSTLKVKTTMSLMILLKKMTLQSAHLHSSTTDMFPRNLLVGLGSQDWVAP
jgi:hypothetical protein